LPSCAASTAFSVFSRLAQLFGTLFRQGESDVDLLVEFAPIGGHAKFHAYFEMLDELQRVLGTKVDLVMSGAVRNAIIAREIEKTKRIIYGS
jgi:uncharacterized protein